MGLKFSMIASSREVIYWFVTAVTARGLPLHKGLLRFDPFDMCLPPSKKQRAPRVRMYIVDPGCSVGFAVPPFFDDG